MNGLVAHLEELIQNSGRAYYIHKVMIRESAYNGDMMVVFVTQEAAWRLPELAEQLITYPGVVSIYHNINSNLKIMLGRQFVCWPVKRRSRIPLAIFIFQISPQSFFSN